MRGSEKNPKDSYAKKKKNLITHWDGCDAAAPSEQKKVEWEVKRA